MDPKGNPGRVPQPASGAMLVTDWIWRGNQNPWPLAADGGELLIDEYLSPRKLKALTGVEDLQQVEALEMQVDTRENSLGNLGTYLPNLRELKLNNSLLVSVRDLGTTLSHLHILWMAHCGLSDLDGISSCSSLKELYIAYNNISDLSQLPWLDQLEVLDLEGNNIEDINQMQYLGLCDKLSHLTVEGNLICLKPTAESEEDPAYNYRAEVRKLIPHLEYLDEIPARQTDVLPSPRTYKDWLLIKESIQEGGLGGDSSWLGPPLAAELFPEDDSSELTHGLSQVMCGNPTKALHTRRQKLGPPAVRPLKLCSVRIATLHGSGGGGGGGGGLPQDEVSSDLCLQTGQQGKATQALKVTLREEEEEEEGESDCSLTDSSEEGLRETSIEELIGRLSLDASCYSCLSLSSSGSSQAQEGAVFSNRNHHLIPSPPKSPAPASVMRVAARAWSMRNPRRRCLKQASQEEDRQRAQPCQSKPPQEASAQPLGMDFALLNQQSLLAASRSPRQGQPGPSSSQQGPAAGPAAVGSSSIRPIMDKIPPGETNHHQPAACSPTEASERFRLVNPNTTWPLTARAMLQSLPNRPTASRSSQNKSPQP